MDWSLESFGAQVVALGAWNPAIISADWLLGKGLIGEGDAEAARADPSFVVSGQVSNVQLATAHVQTVVSQLLIMGLGPVNPGLRDLAVGILTCLPETPVSALGINFYAHYQITTLDLYNKIGDTLAPKQIWKSVFPDLYPGLQDLTLLIQPVNADGKPVEGGDMCRVQVQPSSKVAQGVYLSINHHFDLQPRKSATARSASDILNEQWEALWQKADPLFTTIIGKALG